MCLLLPLRTTTFIQLQEQKKRSLVGKVIREYVAAARLKWGAEKVVGVTEENS